MANKLLTLLAAGFIAGVGLFSGSAAIAVTPYECPRALPAKPTKQMFAQDYSLIGADLFDTSPENNSRQAPVTFGILEHWDLAKIDPYLVCRYQNTTDTVILHVVGAETCDAGGKVYQASCR
jgi:hypothetical protein